LQVLKLDAIDASPICCSTSALLKACLSLSHPKPAFIRGIRRNGKIHFAHRRRAPLGITNIDTDMIIPKQF